MPGGGGFRREEAREGVAPHPRGALRREGDG